MGISTFVQKVQNTPREIQYGILYHIIRDPRVNFVKLSGVFNGGHGDWDRPRGFDPAQQGVEEVSPLSGSHKLAKVLKEISRASKEAPNRRYFESIESIALNSPTVPTNGDTAGLPHLKTDLINDLQCVSSNGNDPWFPGQIFTGGMVSEHKKLYKLHQICMGLPNFNLITERQCQECGESYDNEPEDEHDNFGDDVTEFCNTCMGELFAHLEYLERVYIIVPDLRPATRADTQQVFRYGDPAAQRRLLEEAKRSDPNHQTLYSDAFEVNPVLDSVAITKTIESFGPGGPCSFDGDGITMYEVAAEDIPEQALEFMDSVAITHEVIRKRLAEDSMGSGPTLFPREPILCGGFVEFKFLSYSLDP